MKLFKKLMAGAMAIAMLSVYTVAFASSVISGSSTSGGATTVSGAGHYAGEEDPVFLMRLPTAANVGNALSFTVDPKEIITNSPPADATEAPAGTVIFATTSGGDKYYKNESAKLQVTSLSSVDVTVNMLATLSDTKMKLSTDSGFSTASGAHLYLGVKVSTKSGNSTVTETEPIDGMGARKATVLKAVPGNFKTTVSGGVVKTTQSGTPANDTWTSVEYQVLGASNPNADWQIEGIAAPNLEIKWMVDPANKITYAMTDPTDTVNTTAAWTAKLDKGAYQKDETLYVFVKPTVATQKLKTAKMKYISIKAADGTMDKEITLTGDVIQMNDANGTPVPKAVNGVYTAKFTFPNPSEMAKSTTPSGVTFTSANFHAPSFEFGVS